MSDSGKSGWRTINWDAPAMARSASEVQPRLGEAPTHRLGVELDWEKMLFYRSNRSS